MTGEEKYRKIEHYVRSNSKKVRGGNGGILTWACFFCGENNPSASMKMGRKSNPITYCSHCGRIYNQLAKGAGIWEENKYIPKQQYINEKYGIRYNYQNIKTGEHTHFKFRIPKKDGGKSFNQGDYDTEGNWIGNLDNIDTSLSIFCNDKYGKLMEAIKNKEPVSYCEGEKDCITLWNNNCISFTSGGASGAFKEAILPFLTGGNFVVFGDNDPDGIKSADKITTLLNTIGNAITIIPPDVPKKGDITDYAETHSKEDLQALLKSAVDSLYKNTVKEKDMESSQLPAQAQQEQVAITTKQNITESVLPLLEYKEIKKSGGITEKKILQTVKNFEIILENDERFKGKIKFNEFSREPYLIGNVPWEHENNNRNWGSYDDSALFSIIQSCYGLHSRNDFYDAVKIISMKNKYHPVRDLLDSLKYDGKEHIRNLFPDYLGVTKDEYSYQVIRLWMLGGVARIYQPGIKFDYTPILKGPQGLGKSTMLRLMALDDGWFNDSLDSLDSDKAAQSLMGSWIIELAELKSLARTAGGVDSVKRFLSATQDKYRTPYERRPDVFLRQNIFAGTTNKDDFLQDETGNRRFLILEAGINKPTKNIFSPKSLDDIQAAWAEAVHIWKTEKPTLILPEAYKQQAEELQNENMADDGMLGIIIEYLADKQQTCAIEIWVDALNEMGRPPKWKASEINNIISKLPDWEKTSSPIRFKKYGHQRGFRKIVSKNMQQSCIQSNENCIQKPENENCDFKNINEKTPFD